MAAPATTAPTVLREPELAFWAVAEPAVVGTTEEAVAGASEAEPEAVAMVTLLAALEVVTAALVEDETTTVELTKDLVELTATGVEVTTGTVVLAAAVVLAKPVPFWPRTPKVGSGIREHSPVQEVTVS